MSTVNDHNRCLIQINLLLRLELEQINSVVLSVSALLTISLRTSLPTQTRTTMSTPQRQTAPLVARQPITRRSTRHGTPSPMLTCPSTRLNARGAGFSTCLGASRVRTLDLDVRTYVLISKSYAHVYHFTSHTLPQNKTQESKRHTHLALLPTRRTCLLDMTLVSAAMSTRATRSTASLSAPLVFSIFPPTAVLLFRCAASTCSSTRVTTRQRRSASCRTGIPRGIHVPVALYPHNVATRRYVPVDHLLALDRILVLCLMAGLMVLGQPDGTLLQVAMASREKSSRLGLQPRCITVWLRCRCKG